MLLKRGEALLRKADKLSCESWNERKWANGKPIDPSPTVNQGYRRGLSLAADRVPMVQDASERRLGRAGAPADDMRARLGRSIAVREMQEGGQAAGGDPAASRAAGAEPSPGRLMHDET